MPPIAAPTWWADVQQEREDLGGRSRRPVDEWLDEDLDFAPRPRFRRRAVDAVAELRDFDLVRDDEPEGAEHELHGVFVHAGSAAGSGASRRRGSIDDERFLAPPPPVGERRTVHITGRPEHSRPLPSARRRDRPRTTADRIGPRPDRIAMWAVIIGIILILIALGSAWPS